MNKIKNAACAGSIGYDLKTRRFFLIGCGRWDCPECAPKVAAHWADRARFGLEVFASEGKTAHFVTLTQPGSIKTPEFAYSIMRSQWDKLRRKFPDKELFSYLTFVEQHPKRKLIPHLHLLTTIDWKLSDWKNYAPSAGWGVIVHMKTIGEGSKKTHIPIKVASFYVSKYVAKGDLSKVGMPKGFRRVRASQNWPRAELVEKGTNPDIVIKAKTTTIRAWLAMLEEIGEIDARRRYTTWLHAETEEAQDSLILPE